MKKILIISLLSIFLIIGCQNNKWDKTDPNMPQDYKAQHEGLLQKHLDILDKDPENFDAIFGVAFQNQALGNYKDAEKYYKKALELYPLDFATLNNLAAIYEEVEEYELAAECIKKLYEQNPNNREVTADTVRLLLKADDPENARLALENFAILNKDDQSSETLLFISDLFESIQSYKQTHGKK